MTDQQLAPWAQSADVLYAADSAGARLSALGFMPIVVGDLDSYDLAASPPGTRVVRDPDPDRTDCDKLLSLVRSDGHTRLTLTGIEGDLLDHVLATLTSIVRSDLQVRLVLRSGIGHIVRGGGRAEIGDSLGRRISLLPLTRSSGVTLRGALWEFEGQVCEPGGFLSVSNQGTGRTVVELETGTVLLFVGGQEGDKPTW